MCKVARVLWTSSAYTDRAEIQWLNEIHSKSFDELGDSGESRYAHLDGLLAIALESKLPSDIKRKYEIKNQEACKNGTAILGRQMMWMIRDYFRTASHLSTMYSFETLYELKWFGDDRISEFHDKWLELISNLVEPLGENALRDVLAKKLETSKVLSGDMDHYMREKGKSANLSTPTTDFSHSYLLSIMQYRVEIQREAKMIEARKRDALGKGGGDDKKTPGAPGTTGGKNPKPKHDPKGGGGKQGRGGGGAGGGAGAGAGGQGAQGGKGGKTAQKPGGKNAGGANAGGAGRGKGAQAGTPGPGYLGKPCWYEQANLRGLCAPCQRGPDTCYWVHSNKKIPEEQFKKMRAPTKSPGAPRVNDKPKATFTKGVGGYKYPLCCAQFRKTGVCNFPEKHNGVRCPSRHIDQAQWKKECEELNKTE